MKADPPRGKKAITHYKVLKHFQKASLVECRLETGRTHQIRVHMSQVLKHPIVGDETYANIPKQRKAFSKGLNELMETHPYPLLHACHLSFKHPITGELLSFDSPLPETFQSALSLLK